MLAWRYRFQPIFQGSQQPCSGRIATYEGSFLWQALSSSLYYPYTIAFSRQFRHTLIGSAHPQQGKLLWVSTSLSYFRRRLTKKKVSCDTPSGRQPSRITSTSRHPGNITDVSVFNVAHFIKLSGSGALEHTHAARFLIKSTARSRTPLSHQISVARSYCHRLT